MPTLLRSTLAIATLLAASHAPASTFFKCIDARGAVTVQQTACAVSSAQEEKRVWASHVPSAAASAPASIQAPPATSGDRSRRK